MGNKMHELLNDVAWEYYSEETTLSEFHDAIEAIRTIEKDFRAWIKEDHTGESDWEEDQLAIAQYVESMTKHQETMQDEQATALEATIELFWSGHNASFIVTKFGAEVKSKLPGGW